MAEFANDISTFNASFPNVDGMGFPVILDSIYHDFEGKGIADGGIKIAGVNISSQTCAFENDVQVWACGDQYGTVIIPDNIQPIQRKHIEILPTTNM